jgi:hypothetical protein
MLGALDAGSTQLLLGGAPRSSYATAREFLLRVEDSPRTWPRYWRKNPSDVARGRLFAYQIMSVAERAQRPERDSATLWARLGGQLAWQMSWTSLRRDFQMLEVTAIAARRRPGDVATSLRRLNGFAQLPAGDPMRMEFYARLVDLLHMTGSWDVAAAVMRRELIPSSQRTESPAFQAARLMTWVRGAVRSIGPSIAVERSLEDAAVLLDDSARETGQRHAYFEHWLLCCRAEFEAVAGHVESSLDLLEIADQERRSGGFDANFVRDARALALRRPDTAWCRGRSDPYMYGSAGRCMHRPGQGHMWP